MQHVIVMLHSAISTLLVRAQSTSPLLSMGSWRPPDSAVGRPCTTILGPCLTPVPPPRLSLTPTHGLTSQSSLGLSLSPGRCPVPGAGAALVPPGCPAPGCGGGMGLGCQAQPCCAMEPPAPRPQRAGPLWDPDTSGLLLNLVPPSILKIFITNGKILL